MAATLRQASEDWLRLSTGRYAKSTRQSHEVVMGRFVREVGNIYMHNLTQAHMEAFFYAKPNGIAHRVKPSTANHYRAILTAFLKFSQNRGWLRTDPMANVRAFAKVETEKPRLSAEQLLRSLELARHPRDRMFLALAMNTGMRVSEMLALRVGDVHIDTGEIHVHIFKTGKWDAFPITSDLDAELRTWLTFYTAHCGIPDREWYLLPSKDRLTTNGYGAVVGDPLEVTMHPDKAMSYPRYILNYVFDELGVNAKGMGAHTFRRSVARLYYDHMLDQTESKDHALRITQALLNHSSSQMTEHYIGIERERDARNVSLKGKSFLPKPDSNVVRLHSVQ